jgi:hypothetical protein
MKRGIPGSSVLRDAGRRLGEWQWDMGFPAAMGLWLRDMVLKQAPESKQRHVALAAYNGYMAALPIPDLVKRHRHPDLPDQVEEDALYHVALETGRMLGAVVWQLATEARHADFPSGLEPLWLFAGRYASLAVAGIHAKLARDPAGLLRLHAASCYEAESRGFAVGERVELEFLRELAKRTGVPLPDNAEALIAERRRDAKNLPTGIAWAQVPETPVIGGPMDGASAMAPGAAEELTKQARGAQREAILDLRCDGAPFERGRFAGLTATQPVPILLPEGTDRTFHLGRLAGSLQAALIRARSRLEPNVDAACLVYAKGLMGGQAQSALQASSPDRALVADVIARCQIEANRLAATDADKLACFNWLAEQLGAPVTPALLERRAHLRARPKGSSPGESPEK